MHKTVFALWVRRTPRFALSHHVGAPAKPKGTRGGAAGIEQPDSVIANDALSQLAMALRGRLHESEGDGRQSASCTNTRQGQVKNGERKSRISGLLPELLVDTGGKTGYFIGRSNPRTSVREPAPALRPI